MGPAVHSWWQPTNALQLHAQHTNHSLDTQAYSLDTQAPFRSIHRYVLHRVATSDVQDQCLHCILPSACVRHWGARSRADQGTTEAHPSAKPSQQFCQCIWDPGKWHTVGALGGVVA